MRDGVPVSPSRFGDSPIDGTIEDEGMEGFVCPTCFSRWQTPEQLQEHYEAQHIEPLANYLCPVCKARMNSQAELETHYTNQHATKGISFIHPIVSNSQSIKKYILVIIESFVFTYSC